MSLLAQMPSDLLLRGFFPHSGSRSLCAALIHVPRAHTGVGSSPASVKRRPHSSQLSHSSLPCVSSQLSLWCSCSLLVGAEPLRYENTGTSGELPWGSARVLCDLRDHILMEMRGPHPEQDAWLLGGGGTGPPSQSRMAGCSRGQVAPLASCGF